MMKSSGDMLFAGFSGFLQLGTKYQRERCQNQCDAERESYHMGDFFADPGEMVEHEQGHDRGRQAACRQQADNAPFHGFVVAVMDEHAAGFGDGGEQQVGADGHYGFETEEEYQQRRH